MSTYLSRHISVHMVKPLLYHLRVIAAVRGWEWTRTILVGDYIWPLLQLWNKGPDNLREATIVGIIKLLGNNLFVILLFISILQDILVNKDYSIKRKLHIQQYRRNNQQLYHYRNYKMCY